MNELLKKRIPLNVLELAELLVLAIITRCLFVSIERGLIAEWGASSFIEYSCRGAAYVVIICIWIAYAAGERRNPVVLGFREFILVLFYILSTISSLVQHTLAFLLLPMCIVIGQMYTRVLDKETAAAVKGEEQHTQALEAAYLKRIEENYERTRELWHDISNYTIALNALADRPHELKAYIAKWSEEMQQTMLPVRTGNIVLDAVIGDKYYAAQKAGVSMRLSLCALDSLPLEPGDICAVFGNALDNALEACLKMETQTGRFIELSSTLSDDTVYISFVNSAEQAPPPIGSTYKPNKEAHGLGMRSIERSVSKYGGHMHISFESNAFTLTIALRQFLHRSL